VQEYSFGIQAQIMSALMALHNFIIVHDPSEMSLNEVKPELNLNDTRSSYQAAVSHQEQIRAMAHRDHIALAM
jgi:hypothetical protein